MAFERTRAAWRRLVDNWREANDDARADVIAYTLGYLMMGYAIVWSFGWAGALFVTGWLLSREPSDA